MWYVIHASDREDSLEAARPPGRRISNGYSS